MRSTWIAAGLVWTLVAGLALPRVASADDPPRPTPAPAPTPAPSPTPAPTPAPTPTPPTPPPPSILGVDVDLSTLLEAAAKKTGALFAWSPQDKQIQQRRVRLTRDLIATGELGLPELRRVLSAHELVLIPMGAPGKEIHWVVDARQQGGILKLKPEPVVIDEHSVSRLEAMDGVFVVAAIRTSAALNVRDLRMAAARLVTQQNIGSVTEIPDASTLIVSDFAPNACAIYRLVRQMEAAQGAPGPTGRLVRTVALAHARAEETAQLLTQTFATTPLTPVQINNGVTAPGAPRIQADARTNQLVITGTPSEIESVLSALRTLDVPVEAPTLGIHTIHLERADVGEVVQTLNVLMGNTRGLWSAGPGGSVRPTVTGDARTNTLVIAATDRAFAEMQRLIASLDVAVENAPKEPAAPGR